MLQRLRRVLLQLKSQGQRLLLRLQVSLFVAAPLRRQLGVAVMTTTTMISTQATMTTSIATSKRMRLAAMVSRSHQSRSQSLMTSRQLVTADLLQQRHLCYRHRHLCRRQSSLQVHSEAASCSLQSGLALASLHTALPPTELQMQAHHRLLLVVALLRRRAGCTSCRVRRLRTLAQGGPCGCARCRPGTITAAACASLGLRAV